MKKLEKLKGQKPVKYLVNITNEKYLEYLQKNKYLIFKYKDGENFIWKFIKTTKIEKIEKVNEKYFNIFTNVEGHIYLTDNSSTFVSKEFTLAKVMCDEENKKEKEAK